MGLTAFNRRRRRETAAASQGAAAVRPSTNANKADWAEYGKTVLDSISGMSKAQIVAAVNALQETQNSDAADTVANVDVRDDADAAEAAGNDVESDADGSDDVADADSVGVAQNEAGDDSADSSK